VDDFLSRKISSNISNLRTKKEETIMKTSKMTITILDCRGTSLIAALIMIALLIMPLACATISKQPNLKEVKAKIEGTWILEEWHIKGQVVSPPKVEARFVVHDNALELLMLNRAGEKPWYWYGYGKYTLDASTFSMGFDEAAFFMESTSGITVSHKLPWEGMKSFGIGKVNNQLHMGPSDDNYEIIVDGNTLIYKKDGKILRTYRRAGIE
jgi:hypothetical protein